MIADGLTKGTIERILLHHACNGTRTIKHDVVKVQQQAEGRMRAIAGDNEAAMHAGSRQEGSHTPHAPAHDPYEHARGTWTRTPHVYVQDTLCVHAPQNYWFESGASAGASSPTFPPH